MPYEEGVKLGRFSKLGSGPQLVATREGGLNKQHFRQSGHAAYAILCTGQGARQSLAKHCLQYQDLKAGSANL